MVQYQPGMLDSGSMLIGKSVLDRNSYHYHVMLRGANPAFVLLLFEFKFSTRNFQVLWLHSLFVLIFQDGSQMTTACWILQRKWSLPTVVSNLVWPVCCRRFSGFTLTIIYRLVLKTQIRLRFMIKTAGILFCVQYPPSSLILSFYSLAETNA